MKKLRRKPQNVILITTGFEELSTIYFLDQLRNSGRNAKLVGARSGLINGARGLTVQPDETLGDLPLERHLELLIIPDHVTSIEALLADPRLHRLIQSNVANGGRLAILPTIESAMGKAGFLDIIGAPYCTVYQDNNWPDCSRFIHGTWKDRSDVTTP